MSSTPMLSSLGVGSNLDLSSLLDNLQSTEQGRLKPLQSRESSYKAQLSAYGTLTNAVKDLQSAADKLNDASLYNSTQANVSGDAVEATSSDEAVPGNYNVSVSQLARAQSLVAAPVADKSAAIGQGGMISIAAGDHDPVSIDLSAGDSSLEAIRDAINNADAGVSASIIDDGSDTPYRLTLSADASGTANQITVSASDADGVSGTPLADLLDYDSNTGTGRMTQTVAAQDASLSVNGIDISRDSNTVDDAIQGVSLKLKSTTSVADQVTTTRDNDTIKSAIKDFVSAYNAYQDKAGKLTAFKGADSSKNGVLLGDSTARSVASQLSGALNTPVSGNSLSMLGDIGISLQTDGKLKIEAEDKLDTALADDPRGVAELFSGDPEAARADDDGVAGMLSAAIGRMVDDNGLLASASDGIQNSIDDVKGRIDDMQDSIDNTVERYRKQFIQLDSMMSDLKSTQSYLTTQLSQLDPSSS